MLNIFFMSFTVIALCVLLWFDYTLVKEIRILLYGYDDTVEDLSVEEPVDNKGIDIMYNPIKTKEFYDNGEFVQIMEEVDFEPGVEVFEKSIDPSMMANKKYEV